MADKQKQPVTEGFVALKTKAAPKKDSPPVLRALRSIRPNRLVMKGPITGKRYEWPYVGYVRDDVDAVDYPELLKMSATTAACCGGAAATKKYVVEA